MLESFFSQYRPNFKQLKSFGFSLKEDLYLYTTALNDLPLKLSISISESGSVNTYVKDVETDDEYTLHHVKEANGSFVSRVREEYRRIITEIRDRCFFMDGFVHPDARFMLDHIRHTYGGEIEYLWDDPSAGAIRHNETQKWYAVLMHVSRRKLGFDSDEIVEITNLHMKPEDADTIIDHRYIFPGYHMNKKHWFTLCLDGTVSHARLIELIEMSYQLAAPKKKKK